MNTPDSIVIAGAGLAGASAAFELRQLGFSGRVTVVGEEQALPYERPPLSKAYLRGEQPIENAQVRAEADYQAGDIELLRGRRAVTLDPARRQLNLDDGSNLGYDALLIATGASPRRLGSARPELRGVHYLRTVDDADALRAGAAEATSIVVIGGGWIGSEVAASLRQLGREVTVIAPDTRPLERVLGPEVAQVYLDLHLEHGVSWIQGMVTDLEGEEAVRAVQLSDGRRVPADLVLVAIGAVPGLKLATRAGLEVLEGGIAVDEHLRSSVPSIYAAGDVAAAWHPRFGRHLRVEHWDNAIHQGRAAAASMLGSGAAYDRTPYFYSDQYDLGMEYRGFATQWGRVVLRGDVPGREFLAFWISDGRVVAAMNANRWDDGDDLLRLVESEARVDLDRLADPDLPLLQAA